MNKFKNTASTEAVDLGVLLVQLAETWWGILPHLAIESARRDGDIRQQGLRALKARLKTYYRQYKVSTKLNLRKFNLKWIKGKGTPKLRAKAGQARALVAFTTALAEEFQHADGELGPHRCSSMKSLAAICDLSKQHYLTQEELVRWRTCSVSHMFHYACCGFNVVPKFHYFQHLPLHILRGGVPRTYWVIQTRARTSK